MALLRRHVDDPDFEDELLRACCVDLTYDAQCEDGRAPYLERLLEEVGGAARWFDALASVLMAPGKNDGDLAQVFYLLCRLATAAPDLDRSRLHCHLAGLTFDAAVFGPMEALVALDGIDALHLCLRVFGDALLDDGMTFGGRCFESLVEALERRHGIEPAARMLEAARGASPPLDALLARPRPKIDAAPRQRPASDYDTIRSRIAAGRAAPFRWGATASADDLRSAAADMAAERDDATRALYLQIFAHCDYPGAPADLAPDVGSPDRRMAHHATRAMSRLAHPDVRALALTLFDERRHPERALFLLRKNFQAGDFARILSVMRGPPSDDDERHALGYAMSGLIDEGAVAGAEADAILFWLYEEEPCSLCRGRAVEGLIASGGLTDAALDECLFDADGGTVEVARAERERRAGRVVTAAPPLKRRSAPPLPRP